MYRPSTGCTSTCTALYIHLHQTLLIPVTYSRFVSSVNTFLYYAKTCPGGYGVTAVLYIERCSHRPTGRERLNGTSRLLQPSHIDSFADFHLRFDDDDYDGDDDERDMVTVMKIMRISHH